jgi:hypothetical protein
VTLKLPGHPTLEHLSGRSVWSIVGDFSLIQKVKAALETSNLKIEVLTHSESLEQIQVKKDRSKNTLLKSSECALCYFFDPLQESTCGQINWTRAEIETALESEKAQKDASKCSVLPILR